MRADEVGFQPDRVPEERGAFSQSLLLKPNGTQDGKGNGSRLRVSESKPRLLICLFQPPLLNQRDCLLQGLGRGSCRLSPQRLSAAQQQQQDNPGPQYHYLFHVPITQFA